MTDIMSIYKRCRKARTKANLNYRQFSEIVGVPIELIKDYEKGKRTIPTNILVEYSKLIDEKK